MHYSCKNGFLDITKLLVDKDKASLNVRQKNGNSPLILAVLGNQFEIVKFLVESGVRTFDKNKWGF